MTWSAWLYRLVPYLGRRAAELERERDHGASQTDAVRAARRMPGKGTRIRERTRDGWGWRWLDDLGRDARHAARGLERSPGFAATVVLVLALGVGANVAMFSIAYGLLFRPLPYPDSEAIMLAGQVWPGGTGRPPSRIRSCAGCGPRPDPSSRSPLFRASPFPGTGPRATSRARR